MQLQLVDMYSCILLGISCVIGYNMTMYIMHYSAFLEQLLLNYISLLANGPPVIQCL